MRAAGYVQSELTRGVSRFTFLAKVQEEGEYEIKQEVTSVRERGVKYFCRLGDLHVLGLEMI